jgi:hypothetical protein
MTMTSCARNLPQHFNGCTCTPGPGSPGAVTAEADVDLTPTEPARLRVSTPPIVPPGLTKPKTCTKCRGGGDFTYASGAPGICAPCNGTGKVESDRATITARKARQDADSAFYRAHATNYKTQWTVSILREHEPERYEKALGSFLNDHPGLHDALVAYYDAAHPKPPPREIALEWGSFDDLPDFAKDAIRHQGDSSTPEEFEAYARERQWQYARVPTEMMAERIMAADPDLVADHGTFEDYHAWYVGRGNVPDHGDSYWPSIEAQPGTGEYLFDGWHRFHSYVAKGMKNVPLLRSRPTPDADDEQV